MEIANTRLRLNKVGSDVPLANVTPPEAMLLHILHGPHNGGLTFGEEFNKIEVVGQAMVASGKFNKIVDKPATPEKVTLGKIITVGVPSKTIKGKLLKEAVPQQFIPAVPAKGTEGKEDYVEGTPAKTVPAQLPVYAPDEVTPAIAEVREPSIVIPAQDEISHQEPVLRPRTDVEELRRLQTKYNGARNKDNKPIINDIWPDRFNPKLPQKFSDLDWKEIGATSIDTANINYATGGLAQTSL